MRIWDPAQARESYGYPSPPRPAVAGGLSRKSQAGLPALQAGGPDTEKQKNQAACILSNALSAAGGCGCR